MQTEGASMINQDFSEWQRAQGYCESIVKTSRGHLKCFRGFLLRNDISSPTLINPGSQTMWVNSYRQDLLDEGKSPNTVNAHLYTLNSYFKFLGYGGHQSARVPEERSRPKALSAKNQWRLFWIVDRALSVRDKAIIYTAFYAGLSVSELAAMNVEDIIFYTDGGRLTVPERTRLKGRRIEFLKTLKPHLKAHVIDMIRKGQYPDCPTSEQSQKVETPLWQNSRKTAPAIRGCKRKLCFNYWAREDLNLHPCGLDPKSSASANFATRPE